MNQTASKGHGHGTSSTTTPGKTPVMKGLFADGIWKCNCDPRMPADHFQTKNGGPNHGRWFYTCQKPQPKRCGFFLWDSEAKPREARAVLSNSNTEPAVSPETDKTTNTVSNKESISARPFTTLHSTLESTPGKELASAPHDQARRNQSKHDDDWLYVSEDDLDGTTLQNLADGVSMPPPETPSKSIKQKSNSSPSKRNQEGYRERSNGRPAYPKPSAESDLFNTPNERRGRGIFSGNQTHPQTRETGQTGGLLSPGITPATNRFTTSYDMLEKIPAVRDESPTARKSTNILESNTKPADRPRSADPEDEEIEITVLASQLLGALKDEAPELTDNPVILNSVKAISLKHTHELNQMQKSRDACRKVIEQQKKQITQLQNEVEKLKRSGR